MLGKEERKVIGRVVWCGVVWGWCLVGWWAEAVGIVLHKGSLARLQRTKFLHAFFCFFPS